MNALDQDEVVLVDLTQPLSERTPVIRLPEQYPKTPRLTRRPLSPAQARQTWTWGAFSMGEHVGTHLDAPIHWYTGRGGSDVSQLPLHRLIGSAAVLDRTAETEADPDYLLKIDDVKSFERVHGPLPEGGWLVLRTGWGRWAHNEARFLNLDDEGLAHTPGFDPDCARWLAHETPIVGVGVETVGTDAGQAALFDPPFPIHHHMLGAGKYGLTQLANVDLLPTVGSMLIVAPLPLVGGTASPARVLALMPRKEINHAVRGGQ